MTELSFWCVPAWAPPATHAATHAVANGLAAAYWWFSIS